MKKHKPNFTHWDDEHTKLIRRTKAPEFVDPVYYVKAHIREDRKWPHPYFLNKRCWALMNKHGPFRGTYKDCEKLIDRHKGEDAYIFCPGPSMGDVADLSLFDDKLTFAINSAGFKVNSDYWVMAESGYGRWLIEQKLPKGKRCVIATARVAVVIRDEEIKTRNTRFSPVYVIRWEEEFVVPPRTPAVSITNALVTAWQMGCSRVFLIGLDLSKPGGPYVEGVPHTKEGADNGFDDQIMALRQFEMPGLEVINTSPYSKNALENFEYRSIKSVMHDLSSTKVVNLPDEVVDASNAQSDEDEFNRDLDRALIDDPEEISIIDRNFVTPISPDLLVGGEPTGRYSSTPAEDTIEKMRAIYTTIYEAKEVRHPKKGLLEPYGQDSKRNDRFVEHLAKVAGSGDMVLDASCGRAHLLKRLIDLGYDAQGTEFVPSVVDDLTAEDLPVTLCSYQSLLQMFGENTFDVVISNDVLEHLTTEEEVFKAIEALVAISSRHVLISTGVTPAPKFPTSLMLPIKDLHLVRRKSEWWSEVVSRYVDLTYDMRHGSWFGFGTKKIRTTE